MSGKWVVMRVPCWRISFERPIGMWPNGLISHPKTAPSIHATVPLTGWKGI